MNYDKIYDSIMFQAHTRDPANVGYTERHTIIPRCVGGNDAAYNIARLTPEERFLAYKLLARMSRYKNDVNRSKLLFACNQIIASTKTNKQFGAMRRALHASSARAKKAAPAPKKPDILSRVRVLTPAQAERHANQAHVKAKLKKKNKKIAKRKARRA